MNARTITVVTTVLASAAIGSPAIAAPPDIVVIGPRGAAEMLGRQLRPKLADHQIVTRPGRGKRTIRAHARAENAAVVVAVQRRGKRRWRVRAVAEDGTTLFSEQVRGRRPNRVSARLARALDPALSPSLTPPAPAHQWQPRVPEPVVAQASPAQVFDDGPNRLKRVELSGYGRSFARLASGNR
ncbi:MAG: hypothetical protein AAFY60_17370 [Myxococcota bacterium]